jgi:vitamin B12/bleomycin/antimicrobial peptide transport system ATP-binding/permease protein
MTESVLSRVATARGFLNQLWKLSAPYWWSEEIGLDRSVLGVRVRVREKWIARGLLALIIGMAVFLVFMSKELNEWNARFYNALQEKNEAAFWAELWFWAQLVFIYLVIAVYRLWLRQLLSIRWRRWLTDVYFRQWLGERTYYHMELSGQGTDNPEQRIEQDINFFTQQTLTLVLGLLSEVMTLATFTVVLWNLSGPLVVPVFGGVTIPGYMMWIAILYAAVGSWLTYKIGYPLVRVNFDLERYNADFRYRLIRIRENAESVALYDGEPDEKRRLQGAFARIYDVWWDYMKYNKRLTWLTVFYSQAAGIFPIIVAAPRYFAGEVPLGTLTQTAGAFSYVQGSLSWFVDSYANLADWKAIVDRLTTFSEAMQRSKVAQATQQGFDVADAASGSMTLQDVELALPNGRVLLEDVDLVIEPGQRLVIQGPSGSGKTTLFRVLAGLWPFGRGRIRVPRNAKALFLPQKPYIPIGTLKEALSYPDKPDAHDDPKAAEVLAACELAPFADRLHESANWAMAMSPGEQQRLAFARALLVKPDWLFLDEATSALDEATETAMYRLVGERLPGVTMISIAHKPSVLRFHDRRLELDPGERRVSLTALPEPAGG